MGPFPYLHQWRRGSTVFGGPKVRIFRQRDNFSDKNVTVSGFDFYDSIRQRIENKRREKFDRLIFGFFRQKGENDEFSDNIFSGGALAPSGPPGHDATDLHAYLINYSINYMLKIEKATLYAKPLRAEDRQESY